MAKLRNTTSTILALLFTLYEFFTSNTGKVVTSYEVGRKIMKKEANGLGRNELKGGEEILKEIQTDY
jgi:hypothetical protein